MNDRCRPKVHRRGTGSSRCCMGKTGVDIDTDDGVLPIRPIRAWLEADDQEAFECWGQKIVVVLKCNHINPFPIRIVPLIPDPIIKGVHRDANVLKHFVRIEDEIDTVTLSDAFDIPIPRLARLPCTTTRPLG